MSKLPVTKLKIIFGEKPSPPPGYTLIDTDLNSGVVLHRENVYLAYTTEPNEGQPITAIQVAASSTEDDPKCVPPDYTKVDGDLNKGAGGKYIYMSYITGTSGEPVTEITVLAGDHCLVWPQKEFLRVNQDCNEGAGGKYIYIAYKKAQQ